MKIISNTRGPMQLYLYVFVNFILLFNATLNANNKMSTKSYKNVRSTCYGVAPRVTVFKESN